MASTSTYHHGDLRTALIDATVDMMTQQGVDCITMRSLSDWVGVSRTAAYRHFENKEALLTAAAIAGFEKFSAALYAARSDSALDKISQFKKMGEAYLQFAMQNPAYYRLMFGDTVTQQNELLAAAAKSAYNELLLMIETLQKNDLIAIEASHLQALYIWSLMHGLASLIINNKLHADENLSDLTQFFDKAISSSLHFTS